MACVLFEKNNVKKIEKTLKKFKKTIDISLL